MDILPAAFNALTSYSQFIAYNKLKQPVNYKTGQIWDAHDSNIWADFETIKVAGVHGIGFVLTDNDPFFLLDIDSCYSPETGWSELAKTLCAQLAGAGVEVSSSGRGLHLIGSCRPFEHGCRNSKLGLELYTSRRFIALTGIHASGNVAMDCTDVLKSISEEYLSLTTPSTPIEDWSTEPVSQWNGPTDDNELLRLALASQSVAAKFGQATTASFADLWENTETVLARCYPPDPNSQEPYNRSSADAALAQHLAFWTGGNAERMLNLMKQSGLYRDKYDREDYLPRTIRGARGKCTNYYSNSQKSSKTQETAQIKSTSGFLTIEEQQEHYEGCTYVCEENTILVPGGYQLDRERFNVMYGGYIFILDQSNSKTTNKAWDAFTNSTGARFPKVNACTFRPDLAPGEIVVRDEERLVNTYWPYNCVSKKGDVSFVLDHIEKLFPNKRDQEIIINYIAALVQFKGKKFRWCIVLQGTQGNGKSFLSEIVSYIVGARYTQYPRADQISSQFNDWEYGTIFIHIEDIYLPESRAEVMETLKPMLVQTRRMIEGKGKKKIMRETCCNYIINTNHKEGLRKSKDDRRFAVFYTAQQSVEDLERDGMLGDYFQNMLNKADNGGYAAAADFFMNYPIRDEFNPLKVSRAPITSTTDAAIEHGLGRVEHEIIEAVESERIGFKGGWISSTALNALLNDIGADKRVPTNKRRDLMRTIGYDWHPHLKEGRVSSLMPGENTKPRLYIKNNHEDRSITDPQEIIKAYKDAQK